MRFFSELSLILYLPEHNIWEDFSFLGIPIKKNYFNSNVDPITGFLYICGYYFFLELKNNDKKIKSFVFSALAFFFGFFLIVMFTFQMLYSFALYAALLTFIFSAFVTYEIELKFFKEKDCADDEGQEKEVESQNVN